MIDEHKDDMMLQTDTHMRKCVRAHTHTRAHTHMHVGIHTHSHTHTTDHNQIPHVCSLSHKSGDARAACQHHDLGGLVIEQLIQHLGAQSWHTLQHTVNTHCNTQLTHTTTHS